MMQVDGSNAAMKLILRGDNRMLAQAEKAKAQLQVELALGRFGEEVQTVVLRFSKGAQGGGQETQRCQIIVDIKPRRIRVEHTDADLTIAMERAADKAARSIARALDEERLRNPSTAGK
jgi:ribosome-associated translation inhibitor RaiA